MHSENVSFISSNMFYLTTIFALIVRQIDDPSQFKEDDILQRPLYLLGGNHAIAAMRRAQEEEPENDSLQRYK